MWYSYENYYVLIVLALIFIELNIIGYIKNKAQYPMISLILFVASLIVHFIQKDVFYEAYIYNAILDLICIGISMINLLIVDEIESRRELIQEVFQNRYEK